MVSDAGPGNQTIGRVQDRPDAALQDDVNDLRNSDNSQNSALLKQEWQKSNEQLESQGVLPLLHLTNDGKTSAENTNQQTSSGQNDLAKQEWTVAVDLTANTGEGQFGAESKQEQLRQLAEQSKGSDVTLDVQYRVPDSDDANAGGTLKHYQIKDGQIIEQEDTRAKGTAQDIQDLVSTASHDDPSNKIALIAQSHGTPQEGIKDGNQNAASLDQINNAITKGLEGSGHDKLDMLDFDSCMMASTATLDKTKDLTDNLVASAQTEAATNSQDGKSDGQNLNAALSDLLKDPGIDGSQLADKFVEEANKGSNREGTQTLAHFDLTKEDQLKNSLDDLGNTLAIVAKDPSNKSVLQNDLKDATRYAPGTDTNETSGLENRDLKQVLTNIQSSLNSGELSDPTGNLAEQVQESLSAEDQITVSQHSGQSKNPRMPKLDANTTGDLSIFAPGTEFNDVQATGNKLNLLNQFGQGVSDAHTSTLSSMDAAKHDLGTLQKNYDQLLAAAPTRADAATIKDALDKDVSSIQSAATLDGYKQAAQKLDDDISSLKETQVYKDFEDLGVQEAQKKKDRIYNAAKNEETAGWNNFMNSLNT